MISDGQRHAFNKISRLKAGALFMETGTGKTRVALDLAASKMNKIDKIIYMHPASTAYEVEAEWKKWHPELQIDMVTVESMSQSERIYLETRDKVIQNSCFLIVDESLKIKNVQAKRTRRIVDLGKYAKYRLVLNGTPLTKNLLDIWPQMEFLSPKILDMSYRQFLYAFTEFELDKRGEFYHKKPRRIPYLVSLIQPYIVEAKLDIEPKKTFCPPDHYYMSASEKEAYQKIKNRFFEAMELNGKLDFYGLISALQGFYTKSADKQRALTALLEKINGKVVIFVKYLHSIPKDALCITGQKNKKQRLQIRQLFKDSPDHNLLYITYGCGSFGLNLQFCQHVVFADQTWDLAHTLQAEARIYRMGQDQDVFYHYLYCDCGLEDMIAKCVHRKDNLLHKVQTEIALKGKKAWLKSI